MFMDYTGYQHLQKSDKNKLFGYAIGHTHVNKTDENNKKVSEFKPIQTDKSDKDITKAFDTSLVDGDVDYSDVPTSIVYIF